MAALLRTLLVVFVLVGCAFAVHESSRHVHGVSPFQVAVPQVHLHNVFEKKLLSFVPTIQTEDSHLIALNLAEQALGFPATYNVKDSYVTEKNGVRHVYLKQTAPDGREIFNADLNINVYRKQAINVGHSFYNGSMTTQPGLLSSIESLKALLAFLQLGSNHALFTQEITNPTTLEHKIDGVKGANSAAVMTAGYIQVDNGKRLEPVWAIQLDMDLSWWNAFVSMRTGEVISLYDWVSDVNTYNVYPIGTNDPDDGPREIVYGPATSDSPLGWHDQGDGNTFTTTIGNNVYAQSNPTGGTAYLNNPRPSSPTLDFNLPINFALQPATYVNASTINLFAWNNYIHDIFYAYGFDEVAGNFQQNNFNKGGRGNDYVIANCQDGSGTNNANFATPADGSNGRMRMYIWTQSSPNRDGDLEQGIVIHEYAHGISNRLTGGPNNVNCLGSGEAGGMGEGWGDFFANVIRQRPTYNRLDVFPMGAYSSNNPKGIRNYPYTTDLKIDPETYGFVNNATYSGVHAKGEVWCGILWETYWNLVDAYGFSSNVYEGDGGNNKILRNVVDGMKFQPCNPNFVDARDAILMADDINYGGANRCLLWQGFAKRGLGQWAIGGRTGNTRVVEDFTVPSDCSPF